MKGLKFHRAIVAIAMMFIGWLPSLAHDFEVDGIYYELINKTKKTVAVTYKGDSSNSYSNEYSGNVVIPSSVNYNGVTYSVTSIGERAFLDCSGLTSVVIGNSVTSIGYYAFDGCSSLTSIVVDAGNSIYDSRNECNAIIETATNTLVFGFSTTIIPDSVTSIGEWAFSFCTSLTNIEIPNSVTSIGNSAFAGCKSLTSIEIPNSVTSIGSSAFAYCESLTSIEIPNSVTSIGINAFANCSKLTSIVVDAGNSKYDSRNGCNAIIETASKTLIAGCQNTIIPNNVTSIGNYAFRGCTRLTSIEIPNSVTSIGYSAFYDCSSLTDVVIGNSVTSIGEFTFGYCTSLTSIEIPNSVTSIGDDAFSLCSSLTSIEIPNRVTSIGDRTFGYCTSLTSVVIGNSVTSIGYEAFSWCYSLTEIKCWATTPPTIHYDTFSNWSAELYVPTGCKAAYEVADYWENFNNIIEVTLDKPITLNDNNVTVASIGDNIVVKNAKLGSNVRVYAADGALIATEIVTDGSVVIKAPVKGICVVAIDGKSFKVMVK